MTADLSALIARLEAAEVGGGELDAAVTVALQLDAKGVTADDHEYLQATVRSDECAPGTYWRCARSGMSLRTSDPITTSIDAALALAERIGLDGFHTMYAALMNWKAHDPRGPASQTLPIALCIAILKAKAQGEGG